MTTSVERRLWLSLLGVAAIVRLGVSLSMQGIIWPDEIMQSVEQAHRLAFGNGVVPWEFEAGARSWLFPGVLAGFLKVGSWLSGDAARAPMITSKVVMVACSLVSFWLTLRLARRCGGATAALAAGVLSVVLPTEVLYAGRAMSEVATAPLVAGAVLLLVEADGRAGRLRGAGALMALATVLRPPLGLIAVLISAAPLVQRRPRESLRIIEGGLAVTAAATVFDLVTWGSPLASLVRYVRFNLLNSGASYFGVSGPFFYAETFLSVAGLAGVALLLLFLLSLRRAPLPGLVVFTVLASLSVVPHKEFRFLVPITPVFLALCGVGLSVLLARGSPSEGAVRTEGRIDRPALVGLVLAALALPLALRSPAITTTDLGDSRPTSGVWLLANDANRLLWKAGEWPALCGLGMDEYFGSTGSFSYLHRDVPLLDPKDLVQPGALESVNALILEASVGAKAPAPFHELLRAGDLALFVREGGCRPPPRTQTRLFSDRYDDHRDFVRIARGDAPAP